MRLRPADWIFLPCSPSSAAATRYWGGVGESERCELMRMCAREYNRANAPMLDEADGEHDYLCRCASEIGVAVVDEEGSVVVAYYGPGDPRNTAVEFRAYQRQRDGKLAERRAISWGVTGDIMADVPQAARTPQESGPCH